MNSIKVSFDNTRRNRKPQFKGEIIDISERMARNIKSYEHDRIKHLASLVGNEGCSFCPSIFKNGRRNVENYDGQHLYVLDIDNGLSWEEFHDRAIKHDLKPLFAYNLLAEAVVYDSAVETYPIAAGLVKPQHSFKPRKR